MLGADISGILRESFKNVDRLTLTLMVKAFLTAGFFSAAMVPFVGRYDQLATVGATLPLSVFLILFVKTSQGAPIEAVQYVLAEITLYAAVVVLFLIIWTAFSETATTHAAVGWAAPLGGLVTGVLIAVALFILPEPE